MVSLELAIQIIALLPPLQFGTPDAGRVTVAVEGSGVLLIAACNPGEELAVGGMTATAGADGTARITVPAQQPDADSYIIRTRAGEKKINGTVNANELLTGTCP